jgi:hypothetical protein
MNGKFSVFVVGALILLALMALVFFVLSPSKKGVKYEVVEQRDFSCAGIRGFAFRYPVFKGWENVSVVDEGEQCELRVKDTKNYTILTVQVRQEEVSGVLSEKNSQGVEYRFDGASEEVRFRMDADHEIAIKLVKLPVYQEDQGVAGFSSEAFFRGIIESFRLVL